MTILKQTTSLDNLVMSGRWKSIFPWGNMIPGKITTLDNKRVDYDGHKLSLSVIETDSVGFYYESISRFETTNHFSSGAFITEDDFGFGTFMFDISFGLFFGLNIVAGLFNDNFSNSIIGFKKSFRSNFISALSDFFSVDTAVRCNEHTIEGRKAHMSYRNSMNPSIRIDWLPGSVSVRVNDVLLIQSTDENLIPTEGMKFGVILTLDDQRIRYNINETIFLNSFKFIPYENKNNV